MNAMKITNRLLRVTTLAAALAMFGLALSLPASAQPRSNGSELSAASALPVVLSITAPALLLGSATGLTIVAVEAASDGTVWLLERASDGARASVRISGQAAGAVSQAVGTTLLASATAAGWVLHCAGKAIAFVPNELGRALLHHERISK